MTQQEAVHYVLPNYRNKQALVKALREGTSIRCFSLDPDTTRNGDVIVTGPNYPEVAQWNAQVRVVNGAVVAVL